MDIESNKMQRDLTVYPRATCTTQAQESTGYKRLTSLWSAIISSKVTEALLATSSSAIHSAKETLLDLNTEQVLLLTLIHSLTKKDIAACFALTEISLKVESLKSPYLRTWLEEEYAFSCEEIRTALGFAADLTKNGLKFPQLVITILENLHYLYCNPKRKNTPSAIHSSTEDVSSLLPINKSQSISEIPLECNGFSDTSSSIKKSQSSSTIPSDHKKMNDLSLQSKLNQLRTSVSSDAKEMSDKPPSNLEKLWIPPTSFPMPKPRFNQDIKPPKCAPILSPPVLGEYKNIEKLALERENWPSSPLMINSPSPKFSDLLTPEEYKRRSRSSGIFVYNEVESANLNAITELANEADSINETTGDTALHLAVARNNIDAVERLLRMGAIVDAVNKVGRTPLQMAVERENLKIIKALHKAGANMHQVTNKKESLLHIAASSAGIEVIDLLIELGVDPDTKDTREQTPLFRAAKKGYIVVMEKLEENGADLYVKDNTGRTLLHYAAWNGQPEAVKWLLDYNLNINEKTRHGWTPLHWAVANRQQQVVHLLLQKGADVNMTDSADRTPLHWATEAGNLALIDLLRSYNGR